MTIRPLLIGAVSLAFYMPAYWLDHLLLAFVGGQLTALVSIWLFTRTS